MSDYPTISFSHTFPARPVEPKFDTDGFVNLFPAAVTKDQLLAMHDHLRQFEQAEAPTEHYFANGMYCRSCVIPKHALVVGKVHKHEHLVMVLKGRITVWSERGRQDLTAPFIGVCPAGAQRLGFAHEDTVFVNVHRTDKTTLAEAEADIVEDFPTSMYGVGNTIIRDQLTLEHVECQ